MILENNGKEAKLVGVAGGADSFTMTLSPIAFQLLSKDLYKNPRRAIVRELSSNALDSHILAGTQDKPFDVHLPTIDKPNFSIRDYGTGLSEQEVAEIYTNFFASTKRDSNEFTGCLGLGSKTPFAYSESFTINTWYAGKKATYAMTMSSGYPSYVKMGEVDSTEPSGLEVVIPIAVGNVANDHAYFAELAAEIYALYKVRPNINKDLSAMWAVTADSITANRVEVIRNVVVNNKRVFTHHYYVVMGSTVYPISSDTYPAISSIPKPDQGCVLIHANVGDVEFTPSREDLLYSEKTVKFLDGALDSYASEMLKQVVNKKNPKTFTEIIRLVYSDEIIKSLANMLKLTNGYNGTTIYSVLERIGSIVDRDWVSLIPQITIEVKHNWETTEPVFGRILPKTETLYTLSNAETLDFRAIFRSGYGTNFKKYYHELAKQEDDPLTYYLNDIKEDILHLFFLSNIRARGSLVNSLRSYPKVQIVLDDREKPHITYYNKCLKSILDEGSQVVIVINSMQELLDLLELKEPLDNWAVTILSSWIALVKSEEEKRVVAPRPKYNYSGVYYVNRDNFDKGSWYKTVLDKVAKDIDISKAKLLYFDEAELKKLGITHSKTIIAKWLQYLDIDFDEVIWSVTTKPWLREMKNVICVDKILDKNKLKDVLTRFATAEALKTRVLTQLSTTSLDSAVRHGVVNGVYKFASEKLKLPIETHHYARRSVTAYCTGNGSFNYKLPSDKKIEDSLLAEFAKDYPNALNVAKDVEVLNCKHQGQLALAQVQNRIDTDIKDIAKKYESYKEALKTIRF